MRSRARLGIGVVAVALMAGTATAATNYVWSGGTHTAPYDTWTAAATNIQTAVDYASTNYPAYDTVLVTNGTYGITNEIAVTNGITVRSVNGAALTAVQRSSGNCRLFSVSHTNAVVDGFTITNGNVTTQGGGVYMTGGVVRNCTISGNYAGGNPKGGGGVYMTGGTVSNCAIVGNGSYNPFGSGSGVYCDGAGLITHCVIRGGYGAGRGGGGICGGYTGSGTSYGTVRNCLITGNVSSGTTPNGGGVCNSALQSSTVCGNSADGAGGGAYGGTIVNSVVYFNIAGSGANYSGSAFSYSCSTPLPAGAGNITDPSLLNDPANNYRLPPGSLCLEAGSNQVWMTGAKDLDGNDRILNGTVDMGAYEFKPGALQCSFSGNVLKGMAPLAVVFTASVAGTNTAGANYQWDFENDSSIDVSGTDKGVVTNSYASAGIYSVKLLVTTAGESASLTRSNYVTACPVTAYVSPVGGNSPPYSSWASAAQSIQAAVDMGTSGTTVWVTNGTYLITSQISVADGIVVQSVNGPTNTIVRRSAGTVRIFYLGHSAAVLDGFTVTNGNPGALAGGGVYCENGATVRNCIVSGNTAGGGGPAVGGGGVYLTAGTVSNCVISGNAVAQNGAGGGVWLGSGGVVRNCLISRNNASDYAYGGGVYMSGGGLVANCTISNNYHTTSGRGGGGINMSGGLVSNCVIVANTGSGSAGSYTGGGVSMSGGLIHNCLIAGNSMSSGNGGGVAGASVQSCTIANNTTDGLGGGTYNTTVTNSIVYFNTASGATNNYTGGSFAYSCTTPDPAGTSNIISDPQFVNAAVGNYRLQNTSTCIDKGLVRAWMTGAFDLGGEARVQNKGVDMGAYETFVPAAGTVFVIH